MFQKLIIAANPSYSTAIETTFWEGFRGACADRGWRLFNASARKIQTDSDTAIIPARLWQLAGFLPDLPESDVRPLVTWMSNESFDRYVDWEFRRWNLDPDEYSERVVLGLKKLVVYIDCMFQDLRPAICLTTNKIDHGTGLFRDAALHYGASAFVIERSPIDSIWIEPCGIFAESEIWHRWPQRERGKDTYWNGVGKKVAIEISRNPEGFRAATQGGLVFKKRLRSFRKPFLFLPMDNVLWTGWAQAGHPQGKLDYPLYGSPVEAIQKLAKIADELGGTLRIKLHPACGEIQAAALPAGVEIISGDLTTIIGEADLVIAFNTKVAFSALALGTPVATLAHNPIAASGATYHTIDPEKVRDTIIEGLSRSGFGDKLELYYTLLGWLKCKYFFDAQSRLNFFYPNQMSLLDRLESAVVDKPVIGMPNEEKINRKNLKNISRWRKVDANLPDVSLDFDVSRLANLKLKHSGITRYTAELLSYFSENFKDFRAVIFDEEEISKKFGGKLADFSSYIGKEVHKVGGKIHDRVLFSPYGPLPGGKVGYDARVLCIHDCFHLDRLAYYFGQNTNYTASVINSIDLESDFLACVSTFTARDLLRLRPIDPSRVFTIHLAASSVFVQPRDVRDDAFYGKYRLTHGKYILVWCQFDPRKNLHGTVMAVARALSELRDENYKALLISSATHRQAVYDLMEATGVTSDHFQVLADLSDEELAALCRRAEFSVFTPYLEGFGLPLIEAMACGCPSVTSMSSSLPEVGGDACLYADPWDPETISDAITTMARSPSLRDTLAKNGSRRSSLFSWQRTGDLTAGLIREAAARLAQHPAGMADEILGSFAAAKQLGMQSLAHEDIVLERELLDGWLGTGVELYDQNACGRTGEVVLQEAESDLPSRHGLHWQPEKIELGRLTLMFEVVLRPIGCATASIRFDLRSMRHVEKEAVIEGVIDLENGHLIGKKASKSVFEVTFLTRPFRSGGVHVLCSARPKFGAELASVTIQGLRAGSSVTEYCGDGRPMFGILNAKVSVVNFPRQYPSCKGTLVDEP
ncbi:glycosyltransferase family 1 protein [Hyphomonas sp.]|uniref:glycosyltransferase family 4 protein n=1 Tax=Alphaproteobacteria TaxID=28211 RepID=UPI003266EEC2